MKLEGVEALVDRLNFLLGLLGHPIFYLVLILGNRFLHPRLHVVEQGVHLGL